MMDLNRADRVTDNAKRLVLRCPTLDGSVVDLVLTPIHTACLKTTKHNTERASNAPRTVVHGGLELDGDMVHPVTRVALGSLAAEASEPL